jgi:transposase
MASPAKDKQTEKLSKALLQEIGEIERLCRSCADKKIQLLAQIKELEKKEAQLQGSKTCSTFSFDFQSDPILEKEFK